MVLVGEKTRCGQTLNEGDIRAIKRVLKIITKYEKDTKEHQLADGFRSFFRISYVEKKKNRRIIKRKWRVA